MASELKVKFPTEPLKCWGKAKELREKCYRDYATAHERGGIRWSGGVGGGIFAAVPAGFGRDVYFLTGEPHGASVAHDKAFAAKCHAAVEEAGYPRDLCAYMRNYWGSEILRKYFFGGPFPEPDFYWQGHMCCSHAKWYQEAARIGGKGRPLLATDVAVGPYWKRNEKTGHFYADPPQNGIRYIADQLHEHIEKLEKYLGRPFQDELLLEAANNFFDNTSLWPEICLLNQTIPAPLDQKTMFSLYALTPLNPISSEHAAFYRELLDEVRDRVDRGIAALATERSRVMDDIQPPWGFLGIYRYLEKFGCVDIGSFYTMALAFNWDIGEDGTLTPWRTPKQRGIEIKDRDQCLTLLADTVVACFDTQTFQEHTLKAYVLEKMYRQWHCNGVMIHYNRGCEGLSLGVAEIRLYLVEHGIPVMSYEGNMGDDREFDVAETRARIDAFMETLGLR